MRKFIPVAEPALVGNERAYVLDCLDSTWISSHGPYIQRFERAIAHFCGVEHAVACSSGTAALHLALLALGIGPGDEVIVPTLTYVATANAVSYCGAQPILVDSEAETWNVDPSMVEAHITPQTKAIIVVHLYGQPAAMQPVLDIARKHGLFVVEDAAEACGAEYRGKRVGSIGDVATFSFFGNKIITTGEGGMVICHDADLAARVRLLRSQGMDLERRYWFPVLGYNYRMTNIAAAIGLAQLEQIEWHLARRRENATLYRAALGSSPELTLPVEQPSALSAYWMNSVVLGETCSMCRDSVIAALAEQGIETRPFFYPLHTLPIYARAGAGRAFPVAEATAARGLSLPSSALLRPDDIRFVCDELLRLVVA